MKYTQIKGGETYVFEGEIRSLGSYKSKGGSVWFGETDNGYLYAYYRGSRVDVHSCIIASIVFRFMHCSLVKAFMNGSLVFGGEIPMIVRQNLAISALKLVGAPAKVSDVSLDSKYSFLLSLCKFYKGEKDCPDRVPFFAWECEERFVLFMMSGNYDPLNDTVNVFCSLGLNKEPALHDGTPIEVQALLFNRYCYQSDISPEKLAKTFSKKYAKMFPLL